MDDTTPRPDAPEATADLVARLNRAVDDITDRYSSYATYSEDSLTPTEVEVTDAARHLTDLTHGRTVTVIDLKGLADRPAPTGGEVA